MTMFKVKRGLETDLPSEILNGTMYFCTDTGNIFIDMGNQRKQISGERALKDSEGNNIVDTYAKKSEVLGTTITDDGKGNVVITNVAERVGAIVEETDPTVPDWAKEPNKPTYTAEEVGARPNTWTPSASDIGLKTENWTFTLEDGSTVKKAVCVG